MFDVRHENTGRMLAAGIMWTGMMQFFIAQAVTQAAWPGYSMRDHDISYLGVTRCGPLTDPMSSAAVEICSPLHGVMNSAFIAAGLLTLFGAVLSHPAWPRLRRTTVAVVMMAIGGIGTVASGIWPLDVNPAAHGVGALVYFVLANVGILVIATTVLGRNKGYALYGIATAVISLTAFVLYGAQIDLGIGRGTMERIAGYPSTVWFVVTGIVLLRDALAVRRAPASG